MNGNRLRQWRQGVVAAALCLGVTHAGAAAGTVNVATVAEFEAALANAQSGDVIIMAPGVYALSRTAFIAVEMTIQGDPSQPTILDGGGDKNVVIVAADNVRLENLTIRNGGMGVGFSGEGTLEIRGATITGHSSIGISSGDSGGHVRVVNSTIVGNRSGSSSLADSAIGIGSACSSFTLEHVTISGNDRGADLDSCGQTFTIRNSLIAFNEMTVAVQLDGGAQTVQQVVEQDCAGGSGFTLLGHTSIDSDGTCRAMPGANSIFTTVQVGLSALADNGGPTPTMALPANSFAIDRAAPCTQAFDQRGAFRSTPACDIGAFERASAITIPSATGAGMVDVTASGGPFVHFRAVAEDDMPNQAGKPAGVSFPYGFFAWSVAVSTTGATTDIAIAFPDPVPTPAQYWKVVNGVWTDVCLQLSCSVSGTSLVMRSFVDGGIGDVDGLANAVITDPGGLGISTDVVDTSAPSVQCAAADGLWHAADVSVACTAVDDGSGLANPGDGAFALSTSVPSGTESSTAETSSRHVCDVAGNCASAGPIGGHRVDKKPPAIAIDVPGNDAVFVVNATVRSAYSCADGGAGVAGCAGPAPTGSPVPTQSVGRVTFGVAATDRVGNAASTSTRYTVTYGLCLLYDPTRTIKLGNWVVIALRVCDANGRNLSSPSIVLQTRNVTGGASNPPAGADPPLDFVYVPAVRGYVLLLPTHRLRPGSYTVNFTAGSDPIVHSAAFNLPGGNEIW